MKNKLFLIIILFAIFANSTAQNLTVPNKQQRNKVKIIKPEKELSNFDDVKSKYKIFKDSEFEYKLKNEITSERINYQYYDILYNGVMIYDAKITIVSKGGIIQQIVHNIPEGSTFEKSNKGIELNRLNISDYEIVDSMQVYYFSEANEKYDLVWKVNAVHNQKYYILFIDNAGQIISKIENTRKSQIVTGTVNTLYNGTQTFNLTKTDYVLWSRYSLEYDYLRSGGIGYADNGDLDYICPWTDFDNNWTGYDQIIATAFWTLQKAQYYFKNVLSFNYSQFGEVDVQMDSLDLFAEYQPAVKEIHYSHQITNVWNSPASVDILAHEYGHHIISTISNGLDDSYYMEPGAIIEGFADVFGKSVQNYIEGYNIGRIETMGEDVIISDLTMKRSFNNPNSMGSHFAGSSSTPVLGQPDTYQGTYWYDGYFDNGGVHGNNGVINFWFYLLTKGGNGYNDFNEYYNVSGIEIDKGAKIVYNSLPLLLFESEFTDARNATILAAENLYGIGSNESQQVLNAWEAVGVDGTCLNSGLDIPDFICSGTSVSIYNYPAGATFTWNQSSNITRNSEQGSNPCSFSSNSSGEGWIEATVNSNCNGTEIIRDTAWVGVPSAAGLDILNPYNYPATTLVIDDQNQLIADPVNPVSITNFEWDFGDWYHFEVGVRDFISFVTTPASFSYKDVKLRGANVCGPTNWYTERFYPGGYYYFSISPNPATNETTLTIESTSKEEVFDETAEWDLEVYDPTQSLKEKKTKLKGNEHIIQTTAWKEGVYFVRVKYKNEILQGKLVVKK